MSDLSLEIEEEFDLSLLGIDVEDASASVEQTQVDNNQPSPVSPQKRLYDPTRPVMKRRASSLLRSITGSYISCDWEPASASASSFRQDEGIVNGVANNIPTHKPHELIAKDYAEGEAQTSGRSADEGERNGVDMEKTASFISTVPSLPDAHSPKPRSSQIVLVRSRLPGRRRYRTKIRVHRHPSSFAINDSTDLDDRHSNVSQPNSASPPTRPDPPTPFQRNIAASFGRGILDKIEHQSKLDSSTGSTLPPVIRDLFPALTEPLTAIRIANVIRRQHELPLLNIKTDKIALRRALATMRDALYVELVSALALPLAPPARAGDTTDTDEEAVKRPTMSLTPTNLMILNKKMPPAFPADRMAIKAFLADDMAQAYGERKGQVVWQGGVGRMRGKGDGGFRGKYETDGLCHVFVDHSNILYGLLHHLAAHSSDALPPRHLRTMSLPCLSLLFRRGRPTPPGSLHLVASSPLHQNLDPLVRLGWEVSVMKRVELYEDEVEDPTSMHTTPKLQSRITGSEGIGLRRYKEQGVDEILQLGILTMLNAKGLKVEKGSTLVLATGDARGGQFNREGFVGAVREALKRGWNVELWSFRSGLSRAWIDMARKERAKANEGEGLGGGGNFTIWALDDWAEQLVEVGEDPDEM